MIDRLRVLLDRPLDPSVARALTALSSAVLIGVAVLLALGVSQTNRSRPGAERLPQPIDSPQLRPTYGQQRAGGAVEPRPAPRRQDPQDVIGSPAARRVAAALRSHRALQHVPYRRGALSIRLIGARGGRALLGVSAPTLVDAKAGWRAFLRRYHDSGRAYSPRFRSGREPR